MQTRQGQSGQEESEEEKTTHMKPTPALDSYKPLSVRGQNTFLGQSLSTVQLLSVYFALLFASSLVTVRGQSALDGFNPNANGVIWAIVIQPDGKILLGGDFTTLAPNGGVSVTRNRIARLNPNGTLDTAFNPNANNTVYAIALQADGKILVGGTFAGASSVGGQSRNRIARLDPATGLADSFNPNANAEVRAIAVQADGKILAGGSFFGASSIGGQTRNRIARLDPSTGAADSFNPNANSGVVAITVQPDGRILAGGFFTHIGGQTRSRLARLDAGTGLADTFNPNANNSVDAIALQADGKILAGGGFTNIGGQPRSRIARLDSGTGAADSFNPNANEDVVAIVVQADGRVLAAGGFTSIGGQTRRYIARLNPTDGLADSFNPNSSGGILALALQPDGKILAGGFFSTLTPNGGAPVTRNNIARLETDGRLDQTLNLSTVVGYVWAIALQPDGKILIGGAFADILGAPSSYIARFNTDGTLDTAFNPNADGDVYAIAVQSDGKILVGGTFSNIGGQPRNRIARLNPTTGAPDSFNPNANNAVVTIAVQPDGRILAGGSFTNIGGQPRNRLARLDASTGLADSFDPNANFFVRAIAVQPDGKILVGGSFNGVNSIGGQSRNRIARLDPGTGLADSFDPNANNEIYTVVVQADGKIVVGGRFNGTNSIGGQTRNRIARLNSSTGLADTFNADVDESVLSIAVQVDGKVLVAGGFASIGGQPRSFLARLSNDTVAEQDLNVTQNAATWTRGGSSPQFTRVTFEDSTDGVNYSFLGHGTAAGSNWTLTGLNLSIGQNLYIRARGYYHSGYSNGSESNTESVRNAFLSPTLPPLLKIQRSGNTNIVLSWATNFNGFTLESKTNLNTNVWSVVTNAPALSGTNNVVTNAIGGSTKFYRLRQ